MDNSLDSLRVEIDKCDKELVAAFVRRMEISRKIGEYKRENKLPVYDEAREKLLYAKIFKLAGIYGSYAERLYKEITALSRELQELDITDENV